LSQQREEREEKIFLNKKWDERSILKAVASKRRNVSKRSLKVAANP